MFQGGRELENFPSGKKKYNDMENIIKLVERTAERGGGW